MTEEVDNSFDEELDAAVIPDDVAAADAADEVAAEPAEGGERADGESALHTPAEDGDRSLSEEDTEDGGESGTAGDSASIETSFGKVTGRLSEIADLMEDDGLSLDDALDLLEEAVSLGMQASSSLDEDMSARDAAAAAEEEAADAAFAQEQEQAEGPVVGARTDDQPAGTPTWR